MKYAYYFKSDSCDEYLVGSDKEYDNVYDFLKEELPDEYTSWEGETDFPYADWVKINDKNRFSFI